MTKKFLIVGTQGQQVTSGPGTFMRYLCESIDSGNFDAEILYPHTSKGTPFSDKRFVHFCKLAAPFYNRFFGSWIITSFFIYLYLKHNKRHMRYHCIWFADRYSALFCVLNQKIRVKSFVMVNDDSRIKRWTEERNKAFSPNPKRLFAKFSFGFFYFSEKFIAGRAAKVVSNSDYLSKILLKNYDINHSKLIRLYKAVDLNAFLARSHNPFQSEPYEVLFIKNEWHRGGLDILIGALSLIQKYSFRLRAIGIGTIEEQQIIKQIAENKGFKGELVLTDFIDRTEIPSIVRNADVFCVPSRKEALGVAFLEALASGTPVVSTNVGGIPEVLDNGRVGYMVEPDDPNALRHALLEVIENASSRMEKVNEGLKHVMTFSKERMIKEMSIASEELAKVD